MTSECLLDVSDLTVYYGHVQALKGVSFQVYPSEIVTLLGANGAGKSTTLRAVSGLVRPRGGDIRWQGVSLRDMPAHRIVSAGISHAPEGRKVFATLTVEENLTLGAYARRGDPAGIAKSRERVFNLFPRLAERRRQLAGTLSGGEQQMLAIGRALMSSPRLLLLDEPSLGLAPMLVKAIFRTVREINEQGVAILLVEQNVRAALRLAHRAYVLETGRIVLSGSAEQLRRDPRVRRAYLGER